MERAGCEAEGPEGEKLRDLSLICGAYDALTAQVALDPRDRLTRTAEKLKDCPWAAGRDLWLDGFTDFTPQQIEVLLQTWLNGQEMVNLNDEKIGAGKGRIALQIHDGGGIKVLWRNLKLTTL